VCQLIAGSGSLSNSVAKALHRRNHCFIITKIFSTSLIVIIQVYPRDPDGVLNLNIRGEFDWAHRWRLSGARERDFLIADWPNLIKNGN
jgi:hypothetical protein